MVDIGFNYVPSNQRIPGIYPEVEGDIPGQPPQWSLLIGQAASTVTSLPGSPLMISSVAAAVRHFGAASMIASMVERYMGSDPNGTLWVMALPEHSGMAFAKGSITFAGTATEAGTINLYIGGRFVSVTVNLGDTAATIATNVVSAITNYFDSNQLGLKAKNRQFLGVKMPVGAAVDGTTAGKVVLTCTFKGTAGNKIDVQLNYYGTSGREELPAGITATVSAMGVDQAGAGDPDTSGLDAILTDTKYDFIVQPWATNPDPAHPGNSLSVQSLTDFQTLMADDTGRWSPLRKVYGHVFSAASFSTNGNDAVSFGATRNDRHMTIVAYEQSAPMPPYDVAAAYAGAFAASSRVDPARPSQTLPVVGILAPHRSARFSAATRQTLLGVGLALMDYEPDYTCRILRAVTTYQLDENGSPDISYRDTETLYTLMAVVRQMTADWGAAYPRAKIIDDDVAFGPGSSFAAGLPDQPVVTTKSGKAVLTASYSRMANGNSQAIWVTDTDSFASNLILQRNGLDPTRLDALLPIVLASGLRVTAMKVDFALQAAA
jgi:phage tail sheath gpL-like